MAFGAGLSAVFTIGFATVLMTAFTAGGALVTGFAMLVFTTFAFIATACVVFGFGAMVSVIVCDGIKPSAAACIGDIFDITFS